MGQFPVCIEMEIVGDDVVLRTACKDEVLSHSATQDLLVTIGTVLQSIVDAPERSIFSSFPVGHAVKSHTSSVAAPTPRVGAYELRATETTSWTGAEMALRRVLSTVSMVPEEDISKDLSLFHLGLDSISAIKVSALLRKEGVQLSVSELLEAATVDNMARLVGRPLTKNMSTIDTEAELGKHLDDATVTATLVNTGIGRDRVERIMPATAGQAYMLSLWLRSNGTLFYPVFPYKCKQVLDPDRLEKAWLALQAQLSVLRTTFVASSEHGFLQIVLKQVGTLVTWLSNENEMPHRELDFWSAPVALSARHDAQSTVLMLKIHHALYDAVSLPFLIGRLQELFDSCDTRPRAGPGMEDYVASTLAGSRAGDSKAFWTRHLANCGSTLLGSGGATGYAGRRVELFRPSLLDARACRDLQSNTRRHGISLQAVIFAAHARYVAARTRSNEIVLGVYLANRSSVLDGLSTLPAPTLNLLPLRIGGLSRPIMNVATEIDGNLALISRAENASASLAEVARWTGVRIDAFVNFLKLPEASRDCDTDTQPEEQQERTVFYDTQSEIWARDVDRTEIVPVNSPEDFQPPKALHRGAEGLDDAYLVRSQSPFQCMPMSRPRALLMTAVLVRGSC